MLRRREPEDDVLQDGQTRRVPMMLRDALDDAATRYFGRPTKIVAGDAMGSSLHKPGFRIPASPSQQQEARDLKRAALEAYDAEISAAWRNPPTGEGEHGERGAQAGDVCMTDDRRAGHMRMIDGVLTCVADPRRRADGGVTVLDERQRAYLDYDSSIQDAWRHHA